MDEEDKEASGVLCNKRMPSIRLKGRFYKTIVNIRKRNRE